MKNLLLRGQFIVITKKMMKFKMIMEFNSKKKKLMWKILIFMEFITKQEQ